jgi:hypothetical protein
VAVFVCNGSCTNKPLKGLRAAPGFPISTLRSSLRVPIQTRSSRKLWNARSAPYSIQKRTTTKKNRYIQFRDPETQKYLTAVSSGKFLEERGSELGRRADPHWQGHRLRQEGHAPRDLRPRVLELRQEPLRQKKFSGHTDSMSPRSSKGGVSCPSSWGKSTGGRHHGMRRGETLVLTRESVYFEEDHIEMRQAWKENCHESGLPRGFPEIKVRDRLELWCGPKVFIVRGITVIDNHRRC